jgi:phage shock protein C
MSYRPKRLTRSGRERLWAGVAGGMAEYFDVDPAIMRIIWVAAAVLTGGLAVPAYIVMWLVMPRDDLAGGAPAAASAPGAPMGATFTGAPAGGPMPPPTNLTPEEEELLRPVTPPPPFPDLGPVAPPAPPDPEESGRRRRAAGILLIGIGMLFFANQLGIFVRLRWDLIWPLVIVGIGLFILTKHNSGWRR